MIGKDTFSEILKNSALEDDFIASFDSRLKQANILEFVAIDNARKKHAAKYKSDTGTPQNIPPLMLTHYENVKNIFLDDIGHDTSQIPESYFEYVKKIQGPLNIFLIGANNAYIRYFETRSAVLFEQRKKDLFCLAREDKNLYNITDDELIWMVNKLLDYLSLVNYIIQGFQNVLPHLLMIRNEVSFKFNETLYYTDITFINKDKRF
jgi:hypothetical protein